MNGFVGKTACAWMVLRWLALAIQTFVLDGAEMVGFGNTAWTWMVLR